MAFVLRTKDSKATGNGIVYGGTTAMLNDEKDTFFVETDFGNHMKLSWAEILEMYEIVRWTSYERWKADRADLQQSPNLFEQMREKSGFRFNEVVLP